MNPVLFVPKAEFFPPCLTLLHSLLPFFQPATIILMLMPAQLEFFVLRIQAILIIIHPDYAI
jgi:hypothetical protein